MLRSQVTVIPTTQHILRYRSRTRSKVKICLQSYQLYV